MPATTLHFGFLVFSLVLAGQDTSAYPLYVSANGTALLRSAYGGDLVLRPDTGGAIVASSVLQAQGGIALNNTLLAESTITTLQSQVAGLQAAAGQLANLSDVVAQYASLAPVQLTGPPECGPPGGDRLQYVNGSWTCVCVAGWYSFDDAGNPSAPCTFSPTGTQYYGTASQFSTYYDPPNGYNNQEASNANDNNTSCDNTLGVGIAVGGSLSGHANNWWQLDLGTARTVSRVFLYGRRASYGAEFANLQVYISNFTSVVGQPAAVANASLCYAQPVQAKAVDAPVGTQPTVVACGPTFVGRYVVVYQTTGSYLSLCEVSVFGNAANVASTNRYSSVPLVTSLSTLATQLAAQQATLSELTAAGLLTNLSDVVAQYASLAPVQLSGPPECGPPGGDRLQYMNGTWICVCVSNWFGTGCASVYTATTLASSTNPTAVAIDGSGNVYVAEYDPVYYANGYNRIRVVSPNGNISILAGSGARGGFADGAGGSARFNQPQGVAVDSAGNVYVADSGNNRIRVVSPNGTVSTIAGTGVAGFADGASTSAQFSSPYGVAVDNAGNIYVADSGNNRIRVVSQIEGTVNTLAGSGVAGFADGNWASAQFNQPKGVALNNANGVLYVADSNNHCIRAVTLSPNSTTFVSTLAGSGDVGYIDGIGTNARFASPVGVAVDSSGNVYVADSYNHRIRVTIQGGIVSTLAGTGVVGFGDGTGDIVLFNTPRGVAVDSAGNVFVGDTNNNRIRKLALTTTASANSPQQTAAALPLVTSLSALATQLELQQATLRQLGNLNNLVAEYASVAPVQLSRPPECGPPGGDRLQYVNGSWVCVCLPNWFSLDGTAPCLVSPTGTQYYGTASQLSTYMDQGASNANDNNTFCDGVGANGIAAISVGGQLWWQLDIGSARMISRVALYGRVYAYVDWFANLQVYVSNASQTIGQAAALANASICNWQSVTARAVDAPAWVGPTMVDCDFVGRYVVVYKMSGGYLSLCEVKVFGYGIISNNDASTAEVISNSSSVPLVTSMSELATQLAAQQALASNLAAQMAANMPPVCMPPGGDRLLYNGTAWVCMCLSGWSGVSCRTPMPSPPPPSPSPPPPTYSVCNNYTILSDAWRQVGNNNYGGSSYVCDIDWTCPAGGICKFQNIGGNGGYPAGYTTYTSSFNGSGWYRIVVGNGFNYLPEGVVAQNQCGTHGTGYLIGTHPKITDGIVNMTVGFTWDNALNCVNNIQVANCNNQFYVYYLPEACSCANGYCASNTVPTNLLL